MIKLPEWNIVGMKKTLLLLITLMGHSAQKVHAFESLTLSESPEAYSLIALGLLTSYHSYLAKSLSERNIRLLESASFPDSSAYYDAALGAQLIGAQRLIRARQLISRQTCTLEGFMSGSLDIRRSIHHENGDNENYEEQISGIKDLSSNAFVTLDEMKQKIRSKYRWHKFYFMTGVATTALGTWLLMRNGDYKTPLTLNSY